MPPTPSPALPPAVEERLLAWTDRLDVRLRPVLDRHHRNLLALAGSLAAAGHGPEAIAACVRDLLASYEVDLVRAFGGTEGP